MLLFIVLGVFFVVLAFWVINTFVTGGATLLAFFIIFLDWLKKPRNKASQKKRVNKKWTVSLLILFLCLASISFFVLKMKKTVPADLVRLPIEIISDTTSNTDSETGIDTKTSSLEEAESKLDKSGFKYKIKKESNKEINDELYLDGTFWSKNDCWADDNDKIEYLSSEDGYSEKDEGSYAKKGATIQLIVASEDHTAKLDKDTAASDNTDTDTSTSNSSSSSSVGINIPNDAIHVTYGHNAKWMSNKAVTLNVNNVEENDSVSLIDEPDSKAIEVDVTINNSSNENFSVNLSLFDVYSNDGSILDSDLSTTKSENNINDVIADVSPGATQYKLYYAKEENNSPYTVNYTNGSSDSADQDYWTAT